MTDPVEDVPEILPEVPAESLGDGAGGGVETIPTRGGPLPPLRDVTRIQQPSTLGGAIYLGVLAMALVGIGIAAGGAWRTGVSWLGASLIAASVARLLLPEDDAGMLTVRSRNLDAVMLSVVGVVLMVLAATIPNQP